MKKMMCVLGCMIALMLPGCQSQGVPPGQKSPPVNSSSAVGNTPGYEVPNGTPANSPEPSADFPAPGHDPTGIDTTGFQKEMNVQHPFRLKSVCKTEAGYYLSYNGRLYFLDGVAGNVTIVCARPECSHTDIDCNAWINSRMLCYYQGKLYYVNSDAKSDSMYTLYSMDPDGTNHTKIQRLQLEFVPWRTVLGYPILTNGNLYFLEGDDKIYTVKLGQDVSKAVLLFEDDMSHTLESGWKFWADGGEVYAMNHILDDTGYNQDILYRLGTAQSETREIWRSTGLAKDVADASWYITNGHLYYYFPGSDLWDVELSTGDAKKIIALADTVKSASALFTESHVVLVSGREITVYDYSGNLVGEASLSPVFEAYPNAVRCSPIFADGSCVYLLVDRGAYDSTSNLLYQVDWANGSIREMVNWPGADVIYKDTPPEEVTSIPVRGDAGSVKNDTSGAVALSSGERELKNEGSLRGEIEAAHKLPVGRLGLSTGDAVLFHIETRSDDAQLKITLTGTETGAVLEGRVTGSGDIYFEADIADEYRAVMENCSLRTARFTLEYSIGGYK